MVDADRTEIERRLLPGVLRHLELAGWQPRGRLALRGLTPYAEETPRGGPPHEPIPLPPTLPIARPSEPAAAAG